MHKIISMDFQTCRDLQKQEIDSLKKKAAAKRYAAVRFKSDGAWPFFLAGLCMHVMASGRARVCGDCTLTKGWLMIGGDWIGGGVVQEMIHGQGTCMQGRWCSRGCQRRHGELRWRSTTSMSYGIAWIKQEGEVRSSSKGTNTKTGRRSKRTARSILNLHLGRRRSTSAVPTWSERGLAQSFTAIKYSSKINQLLSRLDLLHELQNRSLRISKQNQRYWCPPTWDLFPIYS
jgi:hypothetical protein